MLVHNKRQKIAKKIQTYNLILFSNAKDSFQKIMKILND